MLGKLLKHEIKAAGRMMLILYGVIAAATGMEALIHLLLRRNSQYMSGLLGIPLMLYGMTVVVVCVIVFIYLCVRFYQTMYTAQGYLTHTLPVEAHQLLHAKILVSLGSLALTGVVCVLSVIITASVVTGEGFQAVRDAFWLTISEFADEIGVAEGAAAVFIAGMICLGFCSQLLMAFAGCSIGQLAHRSKGACGIAAIIGLYYLSQIVSLLLAGAVYLASRSFAFQYPMKWVVCLALGALLLWTAVYYMISRVVVRRHLNLG